jgi:DNA-binding LacI/PurR family transcriptional regulator
VVGYDDVDFARCQIRYPLTTISQPKEEVGRAAFQMIHKLIRGEGVASITLHASLVVRATTAAARPQQPREARQPRDASH